MKLQNQAIKKIARIVAPVIILFIAPVVLAQVSNQIAINFDGNSLGKAQRMILFDNKIDINVPSNALIQASNIKVEELSEVEFTLPAEMRVLSKIYQLSNDQAAILQQPVSVTITADSAGNFSDGIYYFESGQWNLLPEVKKDGDKKYAAKIYSLPKILAVLESENYSLVYTAEQLKQKQVFKAGAFQLWLPAKTFISDSEVSVTQQSSSSTAEDLVSPIFSYKITSAQPDKISSKNPLTLFLNYFVDNYYGKEIKFYSTTTGQWVPLKSSNDPANYEVAAKITLTEAQIGIFNQTKVEEGVASWYAFKGGNYAASRTYPKGTKLKVTNLANNKSVTIKVNDVGPEEWTGRLIDLDKVAFKKIASLTTGLISVRVEKVK